MTANVLVFIADNVVSLICSFITYSVPLNLLVRTAKNIVSNIYKYNTMYLDIIDVKLDYERLKDGWAEHLNELAALKHVEERRFARCSTTYDHQLAMNNLAHHTTLIYKQ